MNLQLLRGGVRAPGAVPVDTAPGALVAGVPALALSDELAAQVAELTRGCAAAERVLAPQIALIREQTAGIAEFVREAIGR